MNGKVSAHRRAELHSSTAVEQSSTQAVPGRVIASILDTVSSPVLVSDRSGRVLFANQRSQELCDRHSLPSIGQVNLFDDLLQMDARVVYGQIESGEHDVDLLIARDGGRSRAHVHWLPEPDWLVVQFEEGQTTENSANAQHTVEELLREREITYRNLLAAYLRLQEVNRQKTVFLASAAHELKTPLAVIKGYYDLLLSGSLGKVSDRQRDILQESKDSCERLVRLVSMFLNYSALESGKLVMHLRENDPVDCLTELTARWQDAFSRKQVRLEKRFELGLKPFKFDYQKVQQAVANLLDNALKHTPPGGTVNMTTEPHFWERRAAVLLPTAERRSTTLQEANSVKVTVTDTGPGISNEFHQEIFEDFVRVDRSSSGMGLGLAIAKRLVQAHRGRIWVESEPGHGSAFTCVLPTDIE